MNQYAANACAEEPRWLGGGMILPFSMELLLFKFETFGVQPNLWGNYSWLVIKHCGYKTLKTIVIRQI